MVSKSLIEVLMAKDWQPTANIATSLTLLLAIFVFGWQIRSQILQRRYDKSRFHLESATAGYEEAIRLLSDGNNDRVIWNSAARILKRSEAISKRIKHEDHLDVFAVVSEKYRKELSDILGYRNRNIGAAFFSGAEIHDEPLDNAEQNCIQNIDTDIVETSPNMEIDEAALWIIWSIAQFPEDYDDPLGEMFPEEIVKRETKRFMWPGLYEYLRYKRRPQ